MNRLEVHIVQLAPMRLVSVNGFGEHPENEAWRKLFDLVQQTGIDWKNQQFFGFNNPSPTPASPNYGYEQWMTLEANLEMPEGVEVKTFSGGLYAVAPCSLSTIGEIWQQLVIWREDSPYQQGHHQWLEEVLNPEIFNAGQSDEEINTKAKFVLYLPITE